MTNNTIPNVPRELLERAGNLAFQTQHYPLHEELRALLSSPAYTGEDGLEADCKTCNGHGLIGDAPIECPDCCADDAQAIIDGLRGEVEDLQMELSGTEDRRATAAHNSSAFEGRMGDYQVQNGKLQDRCDQQAQRIAELEGLLREALDSVTASDLWIRIDAALSAGKEGE